MRVNVTQQSERDQKLIREFTLFPQPGQDRFDPDFKVGMVCNRCGKIGYGPRKQIREAITAHWQEDCPARRSRADAPKEMRLLYPKQ